MGAARSARLPGGGQRGCERDPTAARSPRSPAEAGHGDPATRALATWACTSVSGGGRGGSWVGGGATARPSPFCRGQSTVLGVQTRSKVSSLGLSFPSSERAGGGQTGPTMLTPCHGFLREGPCHPTRRWKKQCWKGDPSLGSQFALLAPGSQQGERTWPAGSDQRSPPHGCSPCHSEAALCSSAPRECPLSIPGGHPFPMGRMGTGTAISKGCSDSAVSTQEDKDQPPCPVLPDCPEALHPVPQTWPPMVFTSGLSPVSWSWAATLVLQPSPKPGGVSATRQVGG